MFQKKNGAGKSLRSQLTRTSVAVVLLLALMLSLTTYLLLNRHYTQNTEKDIAETTGAVAETIDTFINVSYATMEELSVNAEVLSMDAPRQTRIFEASAGRNPQFELIYAQDATGMQTARSVGKIGDRSGRWWFQKMLEEKQPFVSKSYYSVGTDAPCVSFFYPMYQVKRFVGVFAADVKLAYLQEMVQKFSDLEQGKYTYILDSEGVVIAHPEELYFQEMYNYKSMTKTVVDSSDGTNISTREEAIEIEDDYARLVGEALGGKTGTAQTRIAGKSAWVSYAPIALKGTNSGVWTVVTVQDRALAMQSVYVLLAWILGIGLVGVLLSVFFLSLFSKRLARSLGQLATASDHLAMGDFSIALDKSDNLELQHMIDAFAQMVSRFTDVTTDIQHITQSFAQGDVQAPSKCPQEYVGNFQGILQGLSYMQHSMSQILGEILRVARDVWGSSQRITEASEGLSRSVAEQEDALHALQESMGQIASLIRTYAQTATEADRISQESVKEILSGKDAMQKMLRSMSGIKETSGKIEHIIQTIDTIAFQTNILALNASVEAARAGEAGKGFAVVANEIRTLAQKTTEAAKSTAELIEASLASVQEGTAVVQQTSETFEGIVSLTEQVTVHIHEMRQTASDQTEALHLVDSHLQDIATGIGETGAVVDSNAQVSGDLQRQAIDLTKSLEGFQI